MFGAFMKAVGQFPDPPIQRVVWLGVLYSAILFFALVAAAWWVFAATKAFDIGWLEWMADALGWGAAVIAGIILFPGAILTILSLMLEPIAKAVERRHYPSLPPAREQPFSEALIAGLKLSGAVMVWNILALPLYLIPVVNVFVFYGLNGYLLGREYFELVAYRRLDPAAAKVLWRGRRTRILLGGVVIAFLMSIPLVNWLMPVVACAFMLHLFEGMRGKGYGFE
jgi:CysZ protein